jgi:hypothetical protein
MLTPFALCFLAAVFALHVSIHYYRKGLP